MAGPGRVSEQDDARAADGRHTAGLLLAAGMFLLLTGPALALAALLLSVAGDPASVTSGPDVLTVAHAAGLLAGVAGGVLSAVSIVWLACATLRRWLSARAG